MSQNPRDIVPFGSSQPGRGGDVWGDNPGNAYGGPGGGYAGSSPNLPALGGGGGGALGFPAGPAQPAGNGLHKVQRLFRGRWHVAIPVVLACAAAGAVWGWSSATPNYRAEGSVLYEPYIPGIGANEQSRGYYREFMNTQALKLQEQSVVESAMNQPAWQQAGGPEPVPGTVGAFQGGLEAKYQDGSYTILLRFHNDDAQLAKAGVDAMLAAAQDQYAASGLQDINRKVAGTKDLIEQNRIRRQELQLEIDDIAARFGTADLEALASENREKLDALQEKIDQNQMLASLAEGALEAKRDTPMSQLAAQDELLRGLLDQQRQMEDELRRIGRRLGNNNPAVVSMREDLQEHERRITEYAKLLRDETATIPNLDPAAEQRTIQVDRAFVDTVNQQLDALEQRRAALRGDGDQVYAAATTINKLESDIQTIESRVAGLTQNLNQLEAQQLGTGSGEFATISMGPANVDNDNRSRMAVVGAVGGGAVPLGIFLLMGLFETSSRFRYSDDQSSQMHGLTLLGILPNLPDRLSDPEQANIAGHCVHQIRTMLQLQSPPDARLAYAITSATSGDGKTSLCLAMGLSFAASGSKTLMIDSDLVGQGLSDRLGLGDEAQFGLLEALAEPGQIDRVTHPTDVEGLSLLPVGSAEGANAGSISPHAMRQLVAEAKKRYETVLIDSGPILGSIEATPVVAAADGVILTVSRGQGKSMVDKALAHLSAVGARVVGVVFNRAQDSDFEQSVNGMSIKSVAQSRPSANGAAARTNGRTLEAIAGR